MDSIKITIKDSFLEKSVSDLRAVRDGTYTKRLMYKGIEQDFMCNIILFLGKWIERGVKEFVLDKYTLTIEYDNNAKDLMGYLNDSIKLTIEEKI